MKGFLLGIVTVALALAVGLALALMGFVGMRADNPASKIETIIAGHAMDASVYRERCTLCHGDPAHPKAALADSLNPPAPQFMKDMADMPENQNFYILQHGIRWTAMPGWRNVLSEQQIWQLVTLLSHMHELPPTAKRVFTDDGAAKGDTRGGQ
jgi:mono/diheme cytochrome c family protein